MSPFEIVLPDSIQYPIVVSLPHIGTAFPESITTQLKTSMLPPDDTDWYLDQLYGFVTALGIPMIKSVYSRWVTDLNRNPDSSPLYNDGRIITHVCTTTNFQGSPIYRDEREVVADEEVLMRKALYFDPYHAALQTLLNKIKDRFGVVLLWDGHSIRRKVPGISATAFPDFIIGSNDNLSAPRWLLDKVAQLFELNYKSIAYNAPFKGGYITRIYGRPEKKQYAIQLEMSKDLYMRDNDTLYDPEKAASIQEKFLTVFTSTGAELLHHAH